MMTTRDPKEAADDALKSHDEAIRALREQHIRRHAIQPRSGNAEELRWWDEGSLTPHGSASDG